MADLIKKIRTETGDLQIDYNALANLPIIPSKISQLTNDSGYVKTDEVVNIIEEQKLENVTANTITVNTITANKVVGAVYA